MAGGRRWSRIFRPDPRTEVSDELSFHLEQRVRDNMSRGMDEASARAAAMKRLGNLDAVRAECTALLSAERRSEARRYRLHVSWLDFKLGFRMLVKYPGLTLVGGLAMAFAIWVGAGGFELVSQVLYPRLPLPDGDRIVGVQQWDAERGRYERRTLHDLDEWRAAVTTIEDLGAFRTVERNLAIAGLGAEPIGVAEITPSAFRIARVRPLMGRTLTDADAQAGAPPVAVISHDVWHNRFDADPAVLGRVVRIGSTPTTIVGVMPDGFHFPIAHQLWVPLRLRASDFARRDGPALRMFGRLADGATLEEARTQLATIGARAAIDHADTHAHLRPTVIPYAESVIKLPALGSALLASSNVLLVLLLVLVCGNVALLLFARAASRESEIVVRNALGASRARITMQLFAEALVLGTAAAVVGLLFASVGLEWAITAASPSMMNALRGTFGSNQLPFWFRSSLSPATIFYAVLLTLLGATIMGVVPALKVTRGLQSRLRAAAAGGGGVSFGGIWTVLIVAQIAVTVAFPFAAWAVRRDSMQLREIGGGFPAEQYLSARVEMDREDINGVPADSATFVERFRTSYQELERTLLAQPGIVGVTYGEFLPRMYHPHRLIEVDEGGSAPPHPHWPGPGYRVSSAHVDPQLFETFDAPILAGRGFTGAEAASRQRVVVVNESFVRNVLGGPNPIGRRVRYIHFEEWESEEYEEGEWHEIVGVVRDLGNAPARELKAAGFYHPAAPEAIYPLQLVVRVRGDAQEFASQLRTLTAAVDPTLRLYDAMPMHDLRGEDLKLLGFWFRLILMVSAIALVLSMAGIYAVTAFAVARRTREIGIRVALGADARRLALAIFKRPLMQLTLGVTAGAGIVTVLLVGIAGGLTFTYAAAVLGYAMLMLLVCLLACVIPTRRALAVEPYEALRQD